MKENIISNDTQYKQNKTGRVFTLKKDYNGYWFLYCKDEQGLNKTLSYPENIMKATLNTSYEMI